jgi:hypothetical protein
MLLVADPGMLPYLAMKHSSTPAARLASFFCLQRARDGSVLVVQHALSFYNFEANCQESDDCILGPSGGHGPVLYIIQRNLHT